MTSEGHFMIHTQVVGSVNRRGTGSEEAQGHEPVFWELSWVTELTPHDVLILSFTWNHLFLPIPQINRPDACLLTCVWRVATEPQGVSREQRSISSKSVHHTATWLKTEENWPSHLSVSLKPLLHNQHTTLLWSKTYIFQPSKWFACGSLPSVLRDINHLPLLSLKKNKHTLQLQRRFCA